MKKSHPLTMEPRSDPVGFAKRSRENLRIIEETKERKRVNSGRVYWLVLFFSMIEGPL